jgi:hypothetical protein
MILDCYHRAIRVVSESISEVPVGLDIRMTYAEEWAVSAVEPFSSKHPSSLLVRRDQSMFQVAMVRMHTSMEREVGEVVVQLLSSLIQSLARSGATYRVGLVGARTAPFFDTVRAVAVLEDSSRYRTSMCLGTYVCNVVVEPAVAHNSIHPILEHLTVLSQVQMVSFVQFDSTRSSRGRPYLCV